MLTCVKCGHSNPDEASFCQSCANPFPANPGAAVPVAAAGAETSGKAIASLICGILFLVFPTAVAAIILGHLSLSDIRHSAGRLTGRGMAVAGLVLGYLGAVLIPVLLLVLIIGIGGGGLGIGFEVPSSHKSKWRANESSAIGNLRKMSIATVTYSATYDNGYPPRFASMDGVAGARDPSCDHALLIDSQLSKAGSDNTSLEMGYVFAYRGGTPGCQNCDRMFGSWRERFYNHRGSRRTRIDRLSAFLRG